MGGCIARSVRKVKEDLGWIIAPSLIVGLCQAAGHAWRDRTLGPVETIYFFITQVLHGSTGHDQRCPARPDPGVDARPRAADRATPA